MGRAAGKTLVVFDFDHTLLDANTDMEVQKLSLGGQLPPDVKQLSRQMGWTEFMQHVFKHLHEVKVTPEQIRKFMQSLAFTKGAADLLNFLKLEMGAEVIIISDSNTVFIDDCLTNAGLLPLIDHIYTNPASFDKKGELNLKPFMHQTDCKLSGINLCKGDVLEGHMKAKNKQENNDNYYSRVVYVGDGLNDFCPMLRLNRDPRDDLAFVRKGYSLEKQIPTFRDSGLVIKAPTFYWSNLHQVIEELRCKD